MHGMLASISIIDPEFRHPDLFTNRGASTVIFSTQLRLLVVLFALLVGSQPGWSQEYDPDTSMRELIENEQVIEQLAKDREGNQGDVPAGSTPLSSLLALREAPFTTILQILVIIVIALFWAERAGYNMSTILAGLGVGSLAVALAAQKTLENVIGAIALYTARPAKAGDFCRLGVTRVQAKAETKLTG